MTRRTYVFFSCLVFFLAFFLLSSPIQALVCTSPKKGAVGGTPLVGAASYTYTPYSSSLQLTPLLKRGIIDELRRNPDPNICSFVGCKTDTKDEMNCCPAKMIKKTIQDRGSGGYWLIFNEPFSEDAYGDCIHYYPCKSAAAAADAAFAISFIKNLDQSARFIVGWYTDNPAFPFTDPSTGKPTRDIINQLPTAINQFISGWHVHMYDMSIDGREIINHPLLTKSPGKEIWITEFGTLGGTDCRYDNIDTDPNQGCVKYMTALVNWLENTNYVTKYFWWNYGPCDPQYINEHSWRRDMCWGPLIKQDGSLNNLGLAFAAIPNNNGICRYGLSPTPTPSPTRTPTSTPTTKPTSPSTPTPIPTPNYRERCNLDNDPQGLVNDTDKDILLGRWSMPGAADINDDGKTNETDLTILLAYWLDNP